MDADALAGQPRFSQSVADAPTAGASPRRTRSPGLLAVLSLDARRIERGPAGQDLPAPNNVARQRVLELWPNGCARFSVDVELRRWLVQCVFRHADRRPTWTGTCEYEEGTLVSRAYEDELPDRREYDVVDIREMATGNTTLFGTSLMQPITANLVLEAVLREPEGEPVSASNSRVRQREPDPPSGLPPATRRRQYHEEHRGSAA